MTVPYIVHGVGGDGKQSVTTVAEAAAVVRSVALATDKRVIVHHKIPFSVQSVLFNHGEGRWSCEGKAEWAEKILAVLRRHG